MTWGEAFVWTCALETPVYVLMLRRAFRGWWAPIVVSIFLQLATHPFLWRFFPWDWGYWPAFFVGETLVVLVEGLLVAAILWRLRERHPLPRGLAAALLANALSATVGLFLN